MATKTTSLSMTTRKLSHAAVAAALMLSTSNLAALGLGALEVNSNLDQPLDGTIELRVAAGDDIGSVTAAIASKEDFERLGIDYPGYLQDMSLSVEDMGGSTYVLRVVSNNVVIKEPFIHFLVRVDWSGGSFLREYTALIDPPIYAADTPASIAEPRVVGTDEAYQAEPQPEIVAEELAPEIEEEVVDEVFTQADTVEEQPAYEEPVVEESFASQDTYVEPAPVNDLPTDAQYGPVARGESLSVIAAELQRQFPDLSIYQIMQVLFEENRSSFIDSNINGLMEGVVLNIGDLAAIREVDVDAAKQFFYDQINQWDPSVLASGGDSDLDGLRVGQDEYAFDDSIASSDTDSFDSSGFTDTTDAFQVGSSTETQAVVSSGDSEARAAEVLAMQQQISDLETSLASSELENQELTERISLLEGQLADMNRLISLDVEDAELAAVESTLAEQNSAEQAIEEFAADGLVDPLADVDSASDLDLANADTFETDDSGFIDPLAGLDDAALDLDTEAEGLADTADAVDSFASDAIGDAETGIDSAVEEVEEAVEEVAEVTPAPAPAKPTSFFSNIKTAVVDDGLWKVIAGAGALLLGGLGVWFTRRRRADEEFEISMMSIESQSQSASDEKAVSVSTDEEKSKTADRETSFLTVYSDSDAVVQADEVDPVAEADVYIAYGRDEQAEEVLLDGIASKPGRVDIKQKLLTLYHKNNNIEGFERIAEELYSQKNFLTKNVWQEVSLMGKDLAPENPLFDVSASELLADDGSEDNMITSGDSVETQSEIENSSALTVDADDDGSGVQFAEEDPSINLINFDDGQSEVSELDEVALDQLNLEDAADEVANAADDAKEAIEDAVAEDDSVFEIDFENAEDSESVAADLEADADADSDGDDIEISVQSVTEVSDLEIADDYDEARTQYELAKVFVDLGDEDGARKILDDIVANEDNSKDVLEDASKLLESINT